MRLRHLRVRNFRGISELDWVVGSNFLCLIGPGDATKSTILDAVELALSPRWTVPFDDADFYGGKAGSPIEITVTVGQVPESLLNLSKFGEEVRGWSSAGELHDEPKDGDEPVLSIRLKVETSLEPSWDVVNDRHPDGRRISSRDREALGCARLGLYLDRHLSWSRGSVLSRLTADPDNISSILAEAGRAARAALDAPSADQLSKLREAAARAQELGQRAGVAPTAAYRPHLDVEAVSVGVGGLSLHDGDVPVRRAGTGTRRLLAVALQREVTKDGGLTLLDEVEHGLEPHRVRRLLRLLRGPTGDDGDRAHVLMTTHSPTVLAELAAADLRVVRYDGGRTSVVGVPKQLGPIVKKTSDALLAKKIIVCEGPTELGLCRALDAAWAAAGPSFALLGIALANGGGSEASVIAQGLRQLGYGVLLLCDGDRDLNPTAEDLVRSGVTVVQWADGVALEERLAADLPWAGVSQMIQLAMDEWGSEEGVRDAVAERAGAAPASLAGAPAGWMNVATEAQLRTAVGLAAKRHKIVKDRAGWFKRVDLAEKLGDIVLSHWGALATRDLRIKLEALRTWAGLDG